MSLRRSFCFAVFLALLGGAAGTAEAGPKPWYWSWWPSHWEQGMWEPYLEDAKHPHNTQWDHKTWEPADWAAQRPNGSAQVIKGFYTAHILHRQYMKDDVPVLEVGPNFYHLSGYDKRRVIQTIDEHFQITGSKLNGMFTVSDWRTHQPIGLYTAHGLQLQ